MASRIFAVDLGSWSVKLAVATPGLRGASLARVVERLVPPGEEPADARARRVLAQLVDELGLRGEPGYLGVYGDQVFTQILDFPFKSLRRADLVRAVGAELESVLPVDLEEMVYCFEAIPAPAPPGEGPADDGGASPRGRVAPPAEGMRALSYAMRRDRADLLAACAREAGFEARGVLACGGAAVRLVERTPSLAPLRGGAAPGAPAAAIAVIDIGHDRTDVVVVASGRAAFSRSIARAGRQVTEAIARHWRLAPIDAERAKHGEGFVASTSQPAATPAAAQLHEVIVPELAPLARDLRQSLAACRARTGHAPVAALLVGGGARLGGLAAYLAEQLGIPAWTLTEADVAALAGPRLAGDAAATASVDAAAMTVGMVHDAATGRPLFDLRAGGAGGGVDFSFLRAKAVPLAASTLLVAAFAAGSAYADLYRLRAAQKVLAPRLARETTEQFGEARSAKSVLSSTTTAASALASPLPKQSAYDILLEMSQHVPPRDKITLDLERLDISDGKVDLAGTAKTPEEVDALVTELKKIECFKEVARGPSETGEGGVKKFKLTITAPCM